MSDSTFKRKFQMQNAVTTYKYLRSQRQINPVDACTDAAQFHNIDIQDLAATLVAEGIDVARLSLI